MLLARLGLRAGEVRALRLEDIDWRAGEILVRGKGPRLERLPLPSDVGEALSAWLKRGRPRCSAREVITRVRAPHGPLTSPGIAAIVYAACERAGVERINAHRLRHTAATEMLRAGPG
jgi:integrase